MKKKVNLYKETPNIEFLLDNVVDWNTLVPLLENDFKEDPERPFNTVEEMVEFYKDVLNLAGEIFGTSVAPRAEILDKEGHKFQNGQVILHEELKKTLKELAESGLLSTSVSRKYGGMNFPGVITMIVFELLSQADSGIATIFGLSEAIAETIERFGTPELKEKFLPLLISGKVTASMDLTEDDAGSDLGPVKLKAYQKDGKWYLKGKKKFITNGCGDLHVVLARTDFDKLGTTKGLSIFLCPKTEKIQIISLEDKMGIKSSPTSEIYFDDAEAYLMGELHNGFKHMLYLMNNARLGVGAQSLGIAQSAFREALKYAQERIQFNTPIVNHPLVFRMLVDMKIKIEAMRMLVIKTAEAADFRKGYEIKLKNLPPDSPERDKYTQLMNKYAWTNRVLTPLTKYYCTDSAVDIVSKAMQIFGGNGYMKDYPIERWYRDVRVTTIYEGTNEIQVLMAMRDIMGQKFQFMFEEIENYLQSKIAQSKSQEPEKKGEFEEFSMESLMSMSEKKAAEEAEMNIYEKLLKAKELTIDATQFLIASISDYGSDLYARFYPKELCNMVIYLFIGYQFLKLADKKPEKLLTAQIWINQGYPEIVKYHKVITQFDTTILKEYKNILEI